MSFSICSLSVSVPPSWTAPSFLALQELLQDLSLPFPQTASETLYAWLSSEFCGT